MAASYSSSRKYGAKQYQVDAERTMIKTICAVQNELEGDDGNTLHVPQGRSKPITSIERGAPQTGLVCMDHMSAEDIVAAFADRGQAIMERLEGSFTPEAVQKIMDMDGERVLSVLPSNFNPPKGGQPIPGKVRALPLVSLHKLQTPVFPRGKSWLSYTGTPDSVERTVTLKVAYGTCKVHVLPEQLFAGTRAENGFRFVQRHDNDDNQTDDVCKGQDKDNIKNDNGNDTSHTMDVQAQVQEQEQDQDQDQAEDQTQDQDQAPDQTQDQDQAEDQNQDQGQNQDQEPDDDADDVATASTTTTTTTTTTTATALPNAFPPPHVVIPRMLDFLEDFGNATGQDGRHMRACMEAYFREDVRKDLASTPTRSRPQSKPKSKSKPKPKPGRTNTTTKTEPEAETITFHLEAEKSSLRLAVGTAFKIEPQTPLAVVWMESLEEEPPAVVDEAKHTVRTPFCDVESDTSASRIDDALLASLRDCYCAEAPTNRRKQLQSGRTTKSSAAAPTQFKQSKRSRSRPAHKKRGPPVKRPRVPPSSASSRSNSDDSDSDNDNQTQSETESEADTGHEGEHDHERRDDNAAASASAASITSGMCTPMRRAIQDSQSTPASSHTFSNVLDTGDLPHYTETGSVGSTDQWELGSLGSFGDEYSPQLHPHLGMTPERYASCAHSDESTAVTDAQATSQIQEEQHSAMSEPLVFQT